ncbi:MAG: DNA-damage-inducible protein D [Parcubacteria group bacterium ADurb.Bin216]|nr:MAG: DNA-damage-inducible protein D [Parcubacteria group bacterium ADurb.Bin216]
MKRSIFEELKKINEHGQEYWSGRELGKALEYSEYRFFIPVIEKAKLACKNSGFLVKNHFEDSHEMISIGTGTSKEAKREVADINMSRFACYLAVQSADSSKVIVGKAKSYFAIQVRRQETGDQFMDDSKRVMLRDEMTEHNKKLASAAKAAGVMNYANFQDAGYMGLYGGLRQKDIHLRKKLNEKQSILDHMGSEELAANLFRATQTEAKLRREGISGQDSANDTHREVGEKVRRTIIEIGGAMPENLPAEESIRESRKRLKKESKALKEKKDN